MLKINNQKTKGANKMNYTTVNSITPDSRFGMNYETTITVTDNDQIDYNFIEPIMAYSVVYAETSCGAKILLNSLDSSTIKSLKF